MAPRSAAATVYHAFRDAKLAEYERYRRAVHPWEHAAYLRAF